MKNGGFPHVFSHKNGESFEQRTASLLPGSLPRPWLPRLPEPGFQLYEHIYIYIYNIYIYYFILLYILYNYIITIYIIYIYKYIHGGFPKWGYPISSSICRWGVPPFIEPAAKAPHNVWTPPVMHRRLQRPDTR